MAPSANGFLPRVPPVKPIYNALDRAGIYDNSARRPANAELRLEDMDRDGVRSQLIFGPIFQIFQP